MEIVCRYELYCMFGISLKIILIVLCINIRLAICFYQGLLPADIYLIVCLADLGSIFFCADILIWDKEKSVKPPPVVGLYRH